MVKSRLKTDRFGLLLIDRIHPSGGCSCNDSIRCSGNNRFPASLSRVLTPSVRQGKKSGSIGRIIFNEFRLAWQKNEFLVKGVFLAGKVSWGGVSRR